MKTIAIVGAGPGLGRSLAKCFGVAGFNVALLARTPERLDRLVAELDELGVAGRAYPADAADAAALTEALGRIEAHWGRIDVLEFSPTGGGAPVAAGDVTPQDVRAVFESQVLGAVAAVRAVLPGMRQRGDGALLFTTGASSVIPVAMMGNHGPAGAALRNYALALNQALAPEGIYAGHLAIDLFIEPGRGEADPDAIAERFFELYERRDHAELKIGNHIEQAAAAAAN